MTSEEATSIVQSIVHVARKSGALRTANAAKVGRAIRVACAHWNLEARALVTPPMRGAAAWTQAEMNVFLLGKALGQVMHKLGLWAGRGAVLNAVASVLAAPEHGRGRQTFARLLGEYGGGEYGVEIAATLGDEEVAGYAIKALLAGGHGEYADRVRPWADDAAQAFPWVKIAARRYLARFEPASADQDKRARRGLRTREAPHARA